MIAPMLLVWFLSCHTSIGNVIVPPFHTMGTPSAGVCMLKHCLKEFAVCEINSQCAHALACTTKCNTTNPSCYFMCEMTYGMNNPQFNSVLACGVSHKCLQTFPDDGNCRVGPQDGDHNLTSMQQVYGDWWVIRGLNPNYDSYKCQHNRFVQFKDGTWHNNVTWNNTFVVPPVTVRIAPIVTIPYPGYLLHNYTTAPLRPQIEPWVVVSFPHPEYMLMLWCGKNPVLKYAGAIVVSPHRNADSMPIEVWATFKAAAAKYGVDYDHVMFPNDNTDCPP